MARNIISHCFSTIKSWKPVSGITLMICLSALVLSAVPGKAKTTEIDARSLIEASRINGGLLVHVGCGDGTLSADLRTTSSFLVHAIDPDPLHVAAARKHLQSLGLSGQVAVSHFNGKDLPYVDGLVNLMVVSSGQNLKAHEIARVLAPRGVVMIAGNSFQTVNSPQLVSSKTDIPGWSMFTKTVPPEIDDWTHYLHGPDGHVMSSDSVVASPHHIQWIGSLKHSRSHKHLTSVNVMVSCAGRLFSIEDTGPTALPETLPSRWALVARDAFNGLELWRRPLSSWQPYYVKDRNSFPADLHRRLVAADDVVFATLSILGPVSALDVSTGETVQTYAGTEKTEDIIHEDGILYLSINTAEASEINRLEMAYRHVEPLQKRVMAIHEKSGKVLWTKCDADTEGLMPTTLAAKKSCLYFQNPENVVCLDKRTGKTVWKSARPSDYLRPGWSSPTLVAFEDIVVSADRQSGPNQKTGKTQYASGGFSTGNIVAFSAATGKKLWEAPCAEGCREPTDVFRRDDELWFGKNLQRQIHEYREAHDPLTGKVLRETPLDENFPTQHHHRCYRDKATSNFILGSRTGVEFTNLDTGKVTLHDWIRGNCKYGVLPCNGLLYLPPEQCGCYIESKLTGFHALAPKRPSPKKDSHPLEKGLAYGKQTPGSRSLSSDNWPTFRHDNLRSGGGATTVPNTLKQAWRTDLGGRLTQPVVADGNLFVASIDEHTLYVLDIDTGKVLYKHIAGARIDSPPTIAGGLAVFGCRDGWIYALDYAKGQLAWRYRAAPGDENMVDNGRVESVWPVHGSVMVQDGAVFFSAGRSSYVDGGVRMGKLDLFTGLPLLNKTFYSRNPETGDTIELYKTFPIGKNKSMEMPGVLPDVLSSDGERIWMRAVTFNPELEIQNEFPAHLFSSMGFLDDSWWDLSYWIYGKHMFGGRKGNVLAIGLYPNARIMVCDEKKTYGYQEGYETIKKAALVAASKKPKESDLKREGKPRHVTQKWNREIPLHVFGLVLAGDTLFMAGPEKIDTVKTRELVETLVTDNYDLSPPLKNATETFLGKKGGLLYAVNKTDGAPVMKTNLDAVPVFDGLIAANGRLFISLNDGSVACMK
ncbi:MAG: PQQ-binding-like beta-propeller repeat protein [Kiritimatiellales bacterium]|nr:PQQ-binding-like beta-propeller repeat protein [Kiritimatiellales bacterium]